MTKSEKEEVALRLRCLETVIPCATKYGLERGDIFRIAEQAWEFATGTITDTPQQTG